MDEERFNDLADATLSALETVLDACDAGFDVESKPGGVLELEFDGGSRIVINRHSAAREIWVAARSGGFHFRYQDGRWIGTRDGAELYATLSRVVSQQAGEEITLLPRD